MDTTYGVLCLIPPIVAIGLALWTKQTIFSLFIAVWLGSTMMNGFNPLVGFVKIISDYMIPSLSGNASLIILVTLSGGMIAMLRTTGAAEAFATRVTKVINTAKKGQIVTCLSAFIFSYTEPCLMLGTIMRPVTDMVRISRAKLAYILDSMGCNLAALSPISSYGPFITGLIAAELLASGVEGNEWGIWLNMLPFNLYGVFAMISVLIVAAFGLNFGPMYKEEKRARETGKLLDDGVQPLVPEVKNELPADYKLTMWNFIIPIVCLFGSLFATIFWSGDLVNNGLVGCFRSANITLAICIAFMGGALGAGIMGVSTKLFSVTKAFDTFVNGMAELISVPFILVCAWSLGSIVKGMGTSEFLIHIVEHYLTPGMVPALVFLSGADFFFCPLSRLREDTGLAVCCASRPSAGTFPAGVSPCAAFFPFTAASSGRDGDARPQASSNERAEVVVTVTRLRGDRPLVSSPPGRDRSGAAEGEDMELLDYIQIG